MCPYSSRLSPALPILLKVVKKSTGILCNASCCVHVRQIRLMCRWCASMWPTGQVLLPIRICCTTCRNIRGRSAAPARGGSGRDLAGTREESPGDSPRPPRRRTTSPRRPSVRPRDGLMEGDPSRAHEVPVPTEVHDPLEAELACRSVADAMAADEAAALAAEAAAHRAQDAQNALAQAALHGTVFQAA